MRVCSIVVWVLALFCASCEDSQSKRLSERIYSFTKEIVDIGPRDPGSKGIKQVRDILRKEVSGMGFVLREQHFVSNTPVGKIAMKNLYYDIPGQSKEMILLGAHYDSKKMPGMLFVGANDAASSVALLLGLSPWIGKQKLPLTVRVVLFDGEEALRSWSSRDSLYGSKAFVGQMSKDQKVKAAVIVDMISDHDLQLIRSRGSDEKLFSVLEQVLAKSSMPDLLSLKWIFVEDDHMPFMQAGIPTLHLMDFTFGGKKTPGQFWHTEKDDMSRVSKKSLHTMVKLMTLLIPELATVL